MEPEFQLSLETTVWSELVFAEMEPELAVRVNEIRRPTTQRKATSKVFAIQFELLCHPARTLTLSVVQFPVAIHVNGSSVAVCLNSIWSRLL